jgi:hypothetical protein
MQRAQAGASPFAHYAAQAVVEIPHCCFRRIRSRGTRSLRAAVGVRAERVLVRWACLIKPGQSPPKFVRSQDQRRGWGCRVMLDEYKTHSWVVKNVEGWTERNNHRTARRVLAVCVVGAGYL